MNNTVFFSTGVDVDEVLVRMSLIEQVIKNSDSMWILFSVKHPQTFLEL